MQLRYRILNVFTSGGARLSGNPLVVVEDGTGLELAQMQALARQFNVSETTFILPSKRAAALVRIFTPAYEMPFAGHPTLGTAHVCRALGLGGDQLGLEMRAGIIPVTANGDHWTLRAAAATSRLVDVTPPELARLLGLEAGDIGFQPLWIKAGREQLIVPLTSEEAVRKVRPGPELFERLKSADGAGQALVFASMGAKKILGRFFFPDGAAILEDPATGSACANLGAWFIEMGRRPPLSFEVSQGEFVGRPSLLQLEVNADNEVFVGGDVIEIGSGQLNL
ncbi:MAG TPA: PhzF family phenazine biosynthesis protein [Steroidobacteraceae bacterium]|nr:PhzF family phenazine biosynthesis protein [Steroidobacteraceae bacterium]